MFATNVQAVVDLILEKDKNLNQETARYWDEIASRSYLFDRNTKEAAMVASLTPADLLGFYDEHFSADGARRRKLATWVYGNQHQDAEKDGQGEGAEGVEKEAVGVAGEGGGEKSDVGSADAICRKREVIAVTNLIDFKRSMPLLPLRKSTMVTAVEPSKL